MKKEKSCGIVVFLNDKVLVVKHNKGHYGLPKGHVENNETEEETAIRETKEETNVDATIIDGFRKVVTYSPKEGVIKDVVFFVGIAKTTYLKNQECEISKVEFYPIETAPDVITFEDERNVIIAAIDYYKKEVLENETCSTKS